MHTPQLPSRSGVRPISPGAPVPRYRTPPQREGLEDNPDVRPVMVDGTKALSVSLTGSIGTGHSFLIDPADWHHVSAELGARWLLLSSGKGRKEGLGFVTVVSARKVARSVARQPSRFPVLCLSRYLVGAEHPWEAVRHRNGNRLDLRRCNLVVQDNGAQWVRAREKRAAEADAKVKARGLH